VEKTFTPDMKDVTRNQLYSGWKRAVKAVQVWAE